MPHSILSSNASAPCRLEWRPSYWVIASQLVLAVLAAFSALASGMPRLAAWPLAIVAFATGARLARRERAKPVRQLFWPCDDRPASLDGEALDAAVLHWRGPLLFLHWRDVSGGFRQLDWWPDTLSPSQRRELRLASKPGSVSRPAASMAP